MEKWRDRSKASALRTDRQRKKAVKTRADYRKKIVRPGTKAIRSWISPDFVSRSGKTREQIVSSYEKPAKKAAQKYFKKLKQVFQTEGGIPARRYQEAIDRKAVRYGQGIARTLLPLSGYKGYGKGLASLATGWLAGDNRIKDFLKDIDQISQGGPVLITTPGKAGRFKLVFRAQLIKYGSLIIRTDYEAEIVKLSNQEINDFIQKFARPEFVPFRPGGPSHIDFVVEQTADPAKPGQLKKRLCLEIQVALA